MVWCLVEQDRTGVSLVRGEAIRQRRKLFDGPDFRGDLCVPGQRIQKSAGRDTIGHFNRQKGGVCINKDCHGTRWSKLRSNAVPQSRPAGLGVERSR